MSQAKLSYDKTSYQSLHALIDGDIILELPYEYGSCIDASGGHLAWPFVQARVDARLRKILLDTGAETYDLFLTSNDKSNFRIEKATIRPYKGHRPTEKPYWYDRIREFLIAHRGAQEVSGYEADDQLGIEQEIHLYSNVMQVIGGDSHTESIICSLDKDLDMIPGWHYNWRNDEQYWIDELTALHNFYCQLLTGDSTDNIPGLFGVGKSSVLLRSIRELSCELEMYTLVKEEYKKRFGSYWKLFMNENAHLLWILRSDDTNEVLERFDEIEEKIQQQEKGREEGVLQN